MNIKNLQKSLYLTWKKQWLVIVILSVCFVLAFYFDKSKLFAGAFISTLIAIFMTDLTYRYNKLNEQEKIVKFHLAICQRSAFTLLQNYFNTARIQGKFILDDFPEDYEEIFFKCLDFDKIPPLKNYFFAPDDYIFYDKNNTILFQNILNAYFELSKLDYEDKNKLDILANVENIYLESMRVRSKFFFSSLDKEENLLNNILKILCQLAKIKI